MCWFVDRNGPTMMWNARLWADEVEVVKEPECRLPEHRRCDERPSGETKSGQKSTGKTFRRRRTRTAIVAGSAERPPRPPNRLRLDVDLWWIATTVCLSPTMRSFHTDTHRHTHTLTHNKTDFGSFCQSTFGGLCRRNRRTNGRETWILRKVFCEQR